MAGKQVLQTVLDRSAAELLQQLLDEQGIASEICRVAGNPYTGMLTTDAWEIRVSIEDMDEAKGIAAQLEATNEVEQEPDGFDSQTPKSRHNTESSVDPHPARAAGSHIPRFLTLLGLTVCLPVAVGSLHARHRRIGYLLLGMSVTCLFLGIVEHNEFALSAAVVAKLVDAVLAPLLLVRTRRRLGVSSNAELWKGLGLALACALVGCVTAIHFHRQREEIREESQVTRVLAAEQEQILQTILSGGTPQRKRSLPNTALGRSGTAALDYVVLMAQKTRRAHDAYAQLVQQFDALLIQGALETDISQLVLDAEQVRELAEQIEKDDDWDSLCDALRKEDGRTRNTTVFIDSLIRTHEAQGSSAQKTRELAGHLARAAGHYRDAAKLLRGWSKNHAYAYRGGQVVFVSTSPPEEEQKTYAAHLEAIASLERQAEQIQQLLRQAHPAN